MGHLQLYLSTSIFAWLPWVFGYFVEIDGKRYRPYGGWHTYELPAGVHTIRCWWRWMFIPWARETISVEVPDGGVVRVAYRAGSLWGEIRIAHPNLADVPEARLLPAKKR